MPQPSPTPRISVNDLAQYMVASETTKQSIIRRNYDPQPFVVTRYQDARQSIKAYLSDISRQKNPLNDAISMFEQRAADPAESDLRQDDAKQSIEVLTALRGMDNKLSRYQFHDAPHSQPKLLISGVEVSVRADLWIHGQLRGENQIGAALFRMTQNTGGRRDEMGKYVATLLRMHLDQNNPSDRKPANRLCMAVDVRQGDIFVAPNASSRRMNDLEAACRVIHALWGQV
jgi:exonuclease VII small subunit